MPVQCTCFRCGTAIQRYPYAIKQNRSGAFFCSPACRMTQQVLACATCGAQLHKAAWQIAETLSRNGAFYCSHDCRFPRLPFTLSIVSGEPVGLIPIRNARAQVTAHAIVDADMAEWASQWRWNAKKGGYATRAYQREGVRVLVFLHREVLGLKTNDPLQGDHINRNRLDNRRSNLRAVSGAANSQNVSVSRGSSIYRGVSFFKRTGKWCAYVKAGGKRHWFGYFASEHEAGRVALEGRKRLMPFAVD